MVVEERGGDGESVIKAEVGRAAGVGRGGEMTGWGGGGRGMNRGGRVRVGGGGGGGRAARAVAGSLCLCLCLRGVCRVAARWWWWWVGRPSEGVVARHGAAASWGRGERWSGARRGRGRGRVPCRIGGGGVVAWWVGGRPSRLVLSVSAARMRCGAMRRPWLFRMGSSRAVWFVPRLDP